ncbi:MAG TPA: protein-L-isoaspartate(D-aspartate) O-methyltransferase [Candidatus Acidoferrum sp.]|nr:protein-L-isoaspartate(D-aspartate) O-methyltransferase [Candidatus Acidoferrum sp.]
MKPFERSNEPAETDWDAKRREMVARQIRARGIHCERVLAAMAEVPRHLFVPASLAGDAYSDSPLPIGEGQTISQPYIVAAIAEALSLQGHECVLEIGAGCGYLAAVLSLLAQKVIAIEAQAGLASIAREKLRQLGYGNVEIIEGDGSAGWPEGAPYEAIAVSAAAPRVPVPLLEQLGRDGRLVIPVGRRESQELLRIVRTGSGFRTEAICDCRFVPLLGHYGWSEGSSPEGQPNP